MGTVPANQLLYEFVEHSERISSRGFKGEKADWEREGVKRHLELAETLLIKAYNFVSPDIINSELTNHRDHWYRTGTDAAFKNLVPPGDKIPQLMLSLEKWIDREIKRLKIASDEAAQNAFAWQTHYLVLCINPYKEKNSRTARLVLNHIRKLFSLPILVIRYDTSDDYIYTVEEFRRNQFRQMLKDALLEPQAA